MYWSGREKFETNEYRFRSPRIKAGLTAALIADLHNCFFGSGNERLLDSLESIKPDCIFIAGDLVEAGVRGDSSETMELLKKMASLWPVYYGIGNHEQKIFIMNRYSKQKEDLKAGLKASGVKLMRNSHHVIGDTNIKITGLDIPHVYYRRIIHKKIDGRGIEALAGTLESSYYNILLAHDPSHFDAYAEYGSDLVLSGHVHGGIVRLPKAGGILSPEYKFFPKYDSGVYRQRKTDMLVSRGLGSHTVNLRINNVPELIKIVFEPLETENINVCN